MTLHGDYCHVATSSLKSQVSRLKPRLTSVSALEANDNRDQATAPIPFSPIHIPTSLLPVAFPSRSLFFPFAGRDSVAFTKFALGN